MIVGLYASGNSLKIQDYTLFSINLMFNTIKHAYVSGEHIKRHV